MECVRSSISEVYSLPSEIYLNAPSNSQVITGVLFYMSLLISTQPNRCQSELFVCQRVQSQMSNTCIPQPLIFMKGRQNFDAYKKDTNLRQQGFKLVILFCKQVIVSCHECCAYVNSSTLINLTQVMLIIEVN